MYTSKSLLIAAGALAMLPGAAFADAAAGKAKFDAVCSDCHEVADHSGKAPAELTKQLQGISNGTIKHKGKVKLTDTEIADLVAYLTGSKSASASAAPAAAASTATAPAAAAAPAKAAAAAKAPASAAMPAPATKPATSSSGAAPAATATPATAAAGPTVADTRGKHAFEKTCASCHEPKDFAGKSAADLEKTIDGIAKGTVKHKKKIAVSPADAKAIAAYLAATH